MFYISEWDDVFSFHCATLLNSRAYNLGDKLDFIPSFLYLFFTFYFNQIGNSKFAAIVI